MRDLGYNVELEWSRAKFGGAEEMTPVSLRATRIFRRERESGGSCSGTQTGSGRLSKPNQSFSTSPESNDVRSRRGTARRIFSHMIRVRATFMGCGHPPAQQQRESLEDS
jgi:hypothetical protein